MKKSGGGHLAAAGFTLIELVMTLVVVGILAVFAVGRMDFVPVFSQRGVRDKLVAALAYARKAAVAQRRNVCVCIGTLSGDPPVCTAGNQVLFTVDTRTPEAAGATPCNGASESALTLPAPDRDCVGGASNVICSRTDATIGHFSGGPAFRFDAQGAASATVTISVTGQNNIIVEQQTGYVR